ncbi:MAG: hypothetical protein UF068_00200, partial [Slackia isoflavoniconvertens]|nr:hypothetical protein [Slackia isoflavoniconvertens]
MGIACDARAQARRRTRNWRFKQHSRRKRLAEGNEMDIIRAIEQQQIKEVTPFNVGDTVKVH